MNDFLDGYLASEKADKDKLTLKRTYIIMNNYNLHDGVLFSQIMYWHGISEKDNKPRMRVKKDGCLWIAKSYDEWEREVCIKQRTVRRCLERIENRGLIVTKLFKFNNRPVLHIRVEPKQFKISMKNALIVLEKSQSDLTSKVKSITDTTTDTTDNNKVISDASQSLELFSEPKPLIEVTESKPKKKKKPNKVYDTFVQLKQLESTIQKGYCLKIVRELFTDGYTAEQIINCAKDLQNRQWWIENNIKITPSQIKKYISEFVENSNLDKNGNQIEILNDGTKVITFPIKQDSNILEL